MMRRFSPLALCCAFSVTTAWGLEFTVTTADDQLDNPAGVSLSLREAIRDANEGDLITFHPTLNGATVVLEHGQLLSDKGITIDASSLPLGLAIDANGVATGHRVLEVTADASAPGVEARSLTFTGGRIAYGSVNGGALGGGGILNAGSLTLKDCTIVNNFSGSTFNGRHGGGILNTGTLELNRCRVSENSTGDGATGEHDPEFGYPLSNGDGGSGGGISNSGSLTLSHCSLIGNRTGKGGDNDAADNSGKGGYGAGISNSGSCIANSCSFLDNLTGDAGGYARTNGGSGGGIENSGSMEVINSTFSRNSTGNGSSFGSNIAVYSAGSGGAIYSKSPFRGGDISILTLSQCTLSNNSLGMGTYNDDYRLPGPGGGGLKVVSGELVLYNCVIAGNQSVESGADVSIAPEASVELSGISLLSDLEGSGLVEGEHIILASDPMLAPPADNGGLTLSMFPLEGSPVIDAGNLDGMATLPSDQLGLPRIAGAQPDIGSVEYQEIRELWELDYDQDGCANGVEVALGTNPNLPDREHSGNVSVPTITPDGHVRISFGLNHEAERNTTWILRRSSTLEPESFQEIFKYHGPDKSVTLASGVTSSGLDTDRVSVTDENPPDEKAFYQFEAELSEAPSNP